MSLQSPHDLLHSLRAMRDKIDCDPAPRTPTLQELYRLLARRIAEIEAAQVLTSGGGLRVQSPDR